MVVKSTIKKREAASSTKRMLNGESKEILSMIGTCPTSPPMKLSAYTQRTSAITTETYLRVFLKNGVKNDAKSGINIK
jgi:hypothetical protein